MMFYIHISAIKFLTSCNLLLIRLFTFLRRSPEHAVDLEKTRMLNLHRHQESPLLHVNKRYRFTLLGC